MKLSGGQLTRVLFWSVAILLGFLQAWASRMDLGMDTVSYLDMGDYIFAGNWSMAANGIWSPLYPFLLGLTLHTLHPSLYWQYPTVHLLLFLIFLLAAVCFDFFLQQMILFQKGLNGNAPAVSAWVYPSIGYLLFLWSSLGLIGVSETNPDMLVEAFFYLACGFLLKIRRGVASKGVYLGFGAVLGLGYLAKSPMFVIGLVCLGVLCAMDIKSGKRASGSILAVGLFVAIALPLVITLSIDRGKLTFSESGRYNYLVHVNQVPSSHWQGAPEEGQRLLHPTVRVFDQPAAFMFRSGPGGTYPVWYDPSYWYEGAKLRLTLRQTVRAFYLNLAYLGLRLVIALNGSVVASLFLLFFASGRGRQVLKDVANWWFLFVPSIGAVAMFAAVHVEARYVASFLVVAILSLFFAVPTSGKPEVHRALSGTAILLAFMFISPIGPGAIPKNLPSLFEFRKPLDEAPNPNEDTVNGLRALGLRPGDRIASLEYDLCAIRVGICQGPPTWARLGEFQIVAEVYYSPDDLSTRSNNFWDAGAGTQEKLIQALSRSGARIVVSRQRPRGAGAGTWQQIGDTPYYLRWLGENSSVATAATPGPLMVCTSNPRYFCDPNGKVVYLAGDHTWSDMQDLGGNEVAHAGRFDYDAYVDFLRGHGYTWLRLWSFMYSHEPACCKYWSPQVGPVWPWVRAGPSAANDGLPKTDFRLLDPNYFVRLRNRIITAGRNGIYVSVMLFDDAGGSDSPTDGNPFLPGNNVNGVNCSAPCPVTLPLNPEVWNYEQAYIHRVVDTVQDLPNAMYEVDNEPPLGAASWVARVTEEIRNYEASKYRSRHPVGINYGNRVPDANVYDTDADFVSPSTKIPPAATGQCPLSTGNGSTLNKTSSRCKVVINDSDHSYYYTLMQSDGASGQIAWVWENFMLGNGVAFMDPFTFPWPGRNNCLRASATDRGVCDTNGLDGQWNQIRSAIGDVAAYGKKVGLRDMTPQSFLSTSGFCLSNPGHEYLVFSTSNSFTLSTSPARYDLEWFNPVTHAVLQSGTVTTEKTHTFTAPFTGASVLWLHN